MKIPIEVSVIIPTYNGRDKIEGILGTLEIQTHKHFETIVVIDGSTDLTAEFLRGRNWDLRNLKIVEQKNKGRAGARNTGVKNAIGDLLLFFDDDMWIDVTVVEQHIAHHKNFSNTILVGGIKEKNNVPKNDIQKYKAYKSILWESKLPDYPVELGNDQAYLTAAHFSIHKNTFDSLDGFNEELIDAEDFELAIRAMELGIDIYHDKNLYGRHEEHITAKTYIKRLREYSLAHKKIMDIHPEWNNKYNLPNQGLLKSKRRVLYWLFGFRFWIRSIDYFNWMKVLPEKFRYRLYDIILTSLSVYFPKRAV